MSLGGREADVAQQEVRGGRAFASLILERDGCLREVCAPHAFGAFPLGIPRAMLVPGVPLAEVCTAAGLVAFGDVVARVISADEMAGSVTYAVDGFDGRRWWETTVTAVLDEGTILVSGFDMTDWHQSFGDLSRR